MEDKGNYKDGKQIGKTTEYFENGKIKRTNFWGQYY